MSILGSREHTCIEPNVSKLKGNKNEGCRELRDNGGCSFQMNAKSKLSDHHSFNTYRGQYYAWDLEDMVKVGKKIRACPYYAVRFANKFFIVSPRAAAGETLYQASAFVDTRNDICNSLSGLAKK